MLHNGLEHFSCGYVPAKFSNVKENKKKTKKIWDLGSNGRQNKSFESRNCSKLSLKMHFFFRRS